MNKKAMDFKEFLEKQHKDIREDARIEASGEVVSVQALGEFFLESWINQMKKLKYTPEQIREHSVAFINAKDLPISKIFWESGFGFGEFKYAFEILGAEEIKKRVEASTNG